MSNDSDRIAVIELLEGDPKAQGKLTINREKYDEYFTAHCMNNSVLEKACNDARGLYRAYM